MVPDSTYAHLTEAEALAVPDDEFLADVDLRLAGRTPKRPARLDDPDDTTWEQEAATLDHLKGGWAGFLVNRAKASLDTPCRSRRYHGLNEVASLTQAGMTIAEAAEALGMEEHEAAGALAGSIHRAPRALEMEYLLRAHPDWTYGKIVDEMVEKATVHTVTRMAELLGLERAGTTTAHDRFDGDLYRQIKDAVEASVREHGKPKYADIGRQLGLGRPTVYRIAKRMGWA